MRRMQAGNTVVFSTPDPHTGAEKVVAVVGVNRPIGDETELQGAVAAVVRRHFGFTVDQVLIVPRGRIPRTTSGKIQRVTVRELYTYGRL